MLWFTLHAFNNVLEKEMDEKIHARFLEKTKNAITPKNRVDWIGNYMFSDSDCQKCEMRMSERYDEKWISRSQPILDDSSGKSGAKFYQSYDKLFIIKTLTSEEVERMHSFLKQYHPVRFFSFFFFQSTTIWRRQLEYILFVALCNYL